MTCSDSSKKIVDPVVYKLARVVGDEIYIPATDDEVMKFEDLIDHNSSLQCVKGDGQTAACISNDDIFGQEFMHIDFEGLLDFEDSFDDDGGRSDAIVDPAVDLREVNHQYEEVTQSESTPVDVQIEQSWDRKQADPPKGAAESEPSTSTTGAGSNPDFCKPNGDICLDNLTVRELQATFKTTLGKETNVKDKQWLKRKILMGLSSSCDVSATNHYIVENNKVKKKGKIQELNNKDENLNEVSQTIQMEDDFSGNRKSVQSSMSKYHIAVEDDDNHASKRVRKPTKRYIEVSESDSLEYSGRPVSSVKSSGHGTRNRVRSIHNIQPVRRHFVTRHDSLGGFGVKIPYVSRIRRGRPRENFMSLMKFQSCGMGNTSKPVNKALDEQDRLSDHEIENHELKTTPTTGWVQQPLIKEAGEHEQYSEQSGELNNDSDEGLVDSYSEDDSDDSILTVPTAKGGMRRKHHRPWTLNEVVKLVEGVSRYGAGRWSEIKKIAFATCSHRTSVDLKDKWRNLLRVSFTQLHADKEVQNSKKHASTPIPIPILLRVRELAEIQPKVSPVMSALKFEARSSRKLNNIRSGFL
ncbi:uncharacterized protein [Rutidosis leptorrhynchoides]|uniref:uncharacterized protein isoform X2 n=1 Tax=Rutidosis leptorrhynchoides TaxID=125765 RepID=UPI003A9A538A